MRHLIHLGLAAKQREEYEKDEERDQNTLRQVRKQQ